MKLFVFALYVASAAACSCTITCSGGSAPAKPVDGVSGFDKDTCNAAAALYKSVGSTCTGDCPCFPGDAVVTLANGNTKTMADLQVGDKVLTHNGVYSEVFMFSHRLTDANTRFVEIKTATTSLAITPGHYLYVNGALREAQYVKVGDNVTLASGKAAKVTSVGSVRKDGIYNPHTLQGDIVVDGVLTSTYTAAFSPTLAHVALAPLRALYQAGVDIFKMDIGNALDHLPAWWKTMYAA
jgi:preprotein translocase subunit YajC